MTTAAENIAMAVEISIIICSKKGPWMVYHELSTTKKITLMISVEKM